MDYGLSLRQLEARDESVAVAVRSGCRLHALLVGAGGHSYSVCTWIHAAGSAGELRTVASSAAEHGAALRRDNRWGTDWCAATRSVLAHSSRPAHDCVRSLPR